MSEPQTRSRAPAPPAPAKTPAPVKPGENSARAYDFIRRVQGKTMVLGRVLSVGKVGGQKKAFLCAGKTWPLLGTFETDLEAMTAIVSAFEKLPPKRRG